MPLLSELSEMIVDCEHKTAPVQDDGYPSIRTPNIGRGYFILDGVNRVSEETYRAWTKRAIPKPGDLIMAREAPVGNVAMIPEGLEPCLGQRTLLIRPDVSKVDPAYLTYLLLGEEVQGSIHAKTNGSTVPHLNMKDVRELPIPELPDLPTQRRIAGILSAYDELIANNQRRIAILEEMARALYREWFVRYKAPGVVMGENGVPEGWAVKRLDEIADVNRAQINARTAPEELHYIDIASVSPGSIDELTTYALNDAPGRAKRIVKHGDILWSCVRPNRRSHALVMNPIPNTIASTGFAVLTAKTVPYSYLYYYTTSDDFVGYLTNEATGAAYPAVSSKSFEKAEVVVPAADVLERFGAVATPMFEQADVLRRQATNLRRTRDLLLPRLMSGRVELNIKLK